MKKTISVLVAIIVSLAMLPVNAFADETGESNTWIGLAYPGDIIVTEIAGAVCEHNSQAGYLAVNHEGKLTFVVESNLQDRKLEEVEIYSGSFATSLDNVNFNTLEGSFSVNSEEKIPVSLELKRGRAYLMKSKFEPPFEIYVLYSKDISLTVKTDMRYTHDAESCLLRLDEDKQTVKLACRSNVEGQKINYLEIYSSIFEDTLKDRDYSKFEKKITANADGDAVVSLQPKRDKAYLIKSNLIDDEAPTISEKEISKIKPTVSTAKTAKGIKVNLKTSGGNVTDIKANGYTVQYKIYRAAKKNGKYVLKKTTTAKSYTDTSVKKGKKYYYKVRMYVKDASGAVVKTTSLSKSNVAARTY